MPGTNISFAGNSLQTANILTNDIDHFSNPNKVATMYSLGHANKSALPFVSYPSKTIQVTGVIIGTSIADLDSRIDTFKSYFTGIDQNLDIDYNGSTRRYVANANVVKLARPGGLLYATFSIEFDCTLPFGKDTSVTNFTLTSPTGRTLNSYTDAVTFAGSAPVQLPVITITLTAVTGGASFINMGNAANGQSITVNRTWANGDVLVIDCQNRTVTVNGVPVNFTGAFTEFAPGAQTFQYIDGFTTRTFSIAIAYTKMYL